jgi:tetratricopeptide (TPR) repeat protein
MTSQTLESQRDEIVALRAKGRISDAIARADEIAQRYEASEEARERDLAFVALSLKAKMLATSGTKTAAIDVYSEMLRRFRSDADSPRHYVHALFSQGYELEGLGRVDEALACFDELLDEFGETPPPQQLEVVAKARLLRARLLAGWGRAESATNGYDDTVRRYRDESDAAVRVVVALALTYKAQLFASSGQAEQAIEIYDQVLGYVGGAAEPELRLREAVALMDKGDLQRRLGQSTGASATFRIAVDRFSDDDDPRIDEVVTAIRARLFVAEHSSLNTLARLARRLRGKK